jgi:hypothetical protein
VKKRRKKAIIEIHAIFDRLQIVSFWIAYIQRKKKSYVILQSYETVKVFSCNIGLAINRSIFVYVRQSIYLIIKVVNPFEKKSALI